MSNTQEQRRDDAALVLPPQAVKVAFLTVREVIGQGGMNTLLRHAGLAEYVGRTELEAGESVTFGDIGRLTETMADVYGQYGAKAILQRLGRVQFRTWQEAYPTALGTAKTALRAFPVQTRLRLALNSVSLAARQIAHVECRVSQNGKALVFEALQCPYCSTVRAEQPFCHTAVGALEEVALWASNGKRFTVEETACRAMGHPACRFTVTTKPPE